MRIVGSAELKSVLHYRMLIERLRQAFRSGCTVPPPQHHRVETYGRSEATLSVRPAWAVGRTIAVKLSTVFPDNADHNLPVTLGSVLLLDGKTGLPQAVIDGLSLTTRRAAAASALAATYLARPDAERLLVVGTGTLAPHLIEAYTAVLPIRDVLVWGRDPAKAGRVAAKFRRGRPRVAATEDLEGAVRGAHLIVCATSARGPVVRGAWLPDGVHIDLIGSTTPEQRETDDEAVQRSRVFVDVRDAALQEAGDIVQPIRSGALRPDDIAGDLFDLTRGERGGRRFYDQITLFKAIGTPLEDLAAAELALEMLNHNESVR